MKKLLAVLLVSITLISCSDEQIIEQPVKQSECKQTNPQSDCRIVGVWRNASFQVTLFGTGYFIETALVGGQPTEITRAGTWKTNEDRTVMYWNNGITEQIVNYHFWGPSDTLFLESQSYYRWFL